MMRPACALLLAVLLPGQGAAQPEVARDPAAWGRAIYQGENGAGLLILIGDRAVRSPGLSCAGCHGTDAMGGAEAQAGPDIGWPRLAGELGYTVAGLERLLTEGRRPDGTMLGGVMPRFALAPTGGEAEALAAWLGVVGTIQRTGFLPDRALFHLSPEPGLAPFRQAFDQAVAEAAPKGVYGRRIVLTADRPAIATLAAPQPDPADNRPDLFPLAALIGDEDPAAVRGGSATLAAQVAGVAHGEAGLQLLAKPEISARLQPLLTGGDSLTFLTRADQADPSAPVFVLGADLLADLTNRPGTGRIYAPIDDLAGLPASPAGCVIAVDPRPARRPGPVLARYGRVAGQVLVEALRDCGPDCTRARLMRGLDGLRLEDSDWPPLDYRDHRLTGTAAMRLWQVCDGEMRAFEGD